jgi:N-acetylmuramoyl-L-alanine amidase-like protein
VRRRSITRRQALQAGALAALAGALRPSPTALAAQPASLFEMDLDVGLRAATASLSGWRTTPVLRAPKRFDLIGVRWARGSHAEVQMRARPHRGAWTKWVRLHDAADHAPDGGRGLAGTDPAFTGAADEFQLRLRGTPRRARVVFVRALPTATLARRLSRRLTRRRGAAARAAQAGAPPAMIMRDAWGAAAVPPREPPQYAAVHMAFVHHTVSANDYGPEDSAGIVLGIARYHRNTNGWNDIGYNFLVDKYGQIFEGRAGGIDQPVVGAQAQGWNSNSTGVATIGDFQTIALTPEGIDAVARIIGWKLTVHGVPTEGEVVVTSAGGETNKYPAGTPVTFQRISGHRDGNGTACPGGSLYAQLPQIRALATQYAGPTTGLSVSAPREVRGLEPVDVTGVLRFPDGTSANGVPISLEFEAVGAYWEPMATVVCAADGSWRTLVTFPETGKVRAVFAGDAARGRLESLPRRVTVLARLSAKLGRRRVRFGKSFSLSGTAEPADTVRIVLQRRGRRRWIRERTRTLRVRSGKFKMRLRPRARGRYRVIIQVGRVKRIRYLRVL